MQFSKLLATLRSTADHRHEIHVPESWMQGRTIYGGLSAAIALAGVEAKLTALPPLRTAQVSFIGPCGGDLTVESSILRQGRSMTFVNADVSGDKGLAARALFGFGTARESIFDRDFTGPPPGGMPSPTQAKPFFPKGRGPAFAGNYDSRLARGGHPISASDQHDHYIWVRHHDPEAIGTVALLALADMPPPAMLPMFPEFKPISSITWMLNFLVDEPQSEDGWWLMQSRAEHARQGYSSQDMRVWNSAGEAVITARQSVALFL